MKLPRVEPVAVPPRPHADPKCTCGPCIAHAMTHHAGGCPGGGWTARRYAKRNPQG